MGPEFGGGDGSVGNGEGFDVQAVFCGPICGCVGDADDIDPGFEGDVERLICVAAGDDLALVQDSVMVGVLEDFEKEVAGGSDCGANP